MHSTTAFRSQSLLVASAPFLFSSSPSIILDGEMLVYDPVSDRNLPFGTLKTAALGTLLAFAFINRADSLHKTSPRRRITLVHAVNAICQYSGLISDQSRSQSVRLAIPQWSIAG